MDACLMVVALAVASFGPGSVLGPAVGLLEPGDLDGAPTKPGTGFYWGMEAFCPLGPGLGAEFHAGAALGLGEPHGAGDPGYPSFDGQEADFVTCGLGMSSDLEFLRLTAGAGYYHVRMDWMQDLTGSGSEPGSLTRDGLGYYASVGSEPVRNVFVALSFHFPGTGSDWKLLSLSWRPLRVPVP
jgi:hypothetical protein